MILNWVEFIQSILYTVRFIFIQIPRLAFHSYNAHKGQGHPAVMLLGLPN